MTSKEKEGNGDTLLKELCGDDARLHRFVSDALFENPTAAISSKDLDILIEEAKKNGDYGPALEKAIFEGAQHPDEKERYVAIIQDLASRTRQMIEQQREKAQKEGLSDRAASLAIRIDNQACLIERTNDILGIASKFYGEKLLELGEDAKREARAKERRAADWEGRRAETLEQSEREARARETRKMGGAQKKEAEAQGKILEAAAEERKHLRADERTKAEAEEKRIEGQEKAGREARQKERKG